MKKIALHILTISLTAVVSNGAIIAVDDFSLGSLDTSQWATNGFSGPTYGSDLDGSYIENGYLWTKLQHTPTVSEPLVVSGSWLTPGSGSLLKIYTRTSAVKNTTDPTTGLSFDHWLGEGGSTLNQLLAYDISGAPFDFSSVGTWSSDAPGSFWDFELIDDGSNITWSVVQQSNPANNAVSTFTTTSNLDAPNYIGLYVGGGDNPRLYNVTVAAVPEPASAGLIGLSALVIFLIRRNFGRE